MTTTETTHILVKQKDHRPRGSKNIQAWTNKQKSDTIVGPQDTRCPWIKPAQEESEGGHLHKTESPTMNRDTICPPSTIKLPRLVADGSEYRMFQNVLQNNILQWFQSLGNFSHQ